MIYVTEKVYWEATLINLEAVCGGTKKERIISELTMTENCCLDLSNRMQCEISLTNFKNILFEFLLAIPKDSIRHCPEEY